MFQKADSVVIMKLLQADKPCCTKNNQFRSGCISDVLKLIFLILFLFLQSSVDIFAQNFTKITDGPHVNDGLQSAGCAWGDFNNDGYEDLFVTNGFVAGGTGSFKINNLYKNVDGDSFEKLSIVTLTPDQAPSRAVSWGDYDNDGDLDLFVVNQGYPKYNYVYENNGDETFTRIAEGSVVFDWDESEPAGWFDYDSDGFLDIFVGNPGEPNNLYQNNRDGTFTKITDGSLSDDRNTGEHHWCDFDNDGDYDLLVGYFRTSIAALFVNQGKGNFIKIDDGLILNNPEAQLNPGQWVDYDNDGDWDIVSPGNAIFRNEGSDDNFLFTKISTDEIASIEESPLICSWADIENDGDLDCFVGILGGRNNLFINNGEGSFSKMEEGAIYEEEPNNSAGTAWADYDLDGDMDIFICNTDFNKDNLFYRNDNDNANSWIKFRLTGTAANASAIGAVVKIKATTDSNPVWQIRKVEGQSTFMGQNSLIVHFGLGTASVVDSVIIQWPSGADSVLTNQSVNQLLTIEEKIPDDYLRAAFSADTTYGRGKFDVQFTDLSISDPANPITSWLWDFNGDGIPDSEEQNPLHSFDVSDGEDFDVSLVVSNGVATDTLHRPGLIHIHPVYGNLAMWGEAEASTVGEVICTPDKVIDGISFTPWTSEKFDSEWLSVKLDSVYTIRSVVIQWGSAYGKEYYILTSTDSINWEVAWHEDSGNGNEDILPVEDTEAKYLVWKGVARSNQNYGYTMYEFGVYEHEITSFEVPKRDQAVKIYPNPARNEIKIEFGEEIHERVYIELIDISGKIIFSGYLVPDTPTSITVNLEGFDKGIYTIRVRDSEYCLTRKLMITK